MRRTAQLPFGVVRVILVVRHIAETWEDVMRAAKKLVCVGCLAAGLAVPAGAHAQDWKVTGQFGWFGVGKTYQIEKDHYYWLGEFTGTFFNDKGEGSPFHLAGVKCPAFLDLNLNAKKTNTAGYCIITDLGGDQAYLSWQAAGTPGTPMRNPGTFRYTGGTGKYQGISGDNTFVGVVQVNWQDGTTTGYSTWNR